MLLCSACGRSVYRRLRQRYWVMNPGSNNETAEIPDKTFDTVYCDC